MTNVTAAKSMQSDLLHSFASLLSSALAVSGSTIEQPLQHNAGTLAGLMTATSDNEMSCQAPCLELRRKESAYHPKTCRSMMEDSAASNLRETMAVKRDDMSSLPLTLLWNVSKSFMFLVDSRTRSAITALAQQTRKSSPMDMERTRLMSEMLSSKASSITPTMVVTSFRTLAFSDHIESGLVVPLVLEVSIDLDVLGDKVSLRLEAPGTIQGSFKSLNNEGYLTLTNIEVSIDTAALLKSMMVKAKAVVRRAVGIAMRKSTAIVQTIPALSGTTLASQQLERNQSSERLNLFLRTLRRKYNMHNERDQHDSPMQSSSEHPDMPPPPPLSSARVSHSSHAITESFVFDSDSTSCYPQASTHCSDRVGNDRLLLLTAALDTLKRKGSDHMMKSVESFIQNKRQKTDPFTMLECSNARLHV
jgi:hypothetical protein